MTANTSSVRVLGALPQVGRVLRQPAHTFQVRHFPYVIQPFMIAPVLPNETMKAAMLQSRAVTKPIKNPLIGWWLEHYVFYCPFSCLPHADDLKELMITEGASLPNVSTSANVGHYHKNGPNYVNECLIAVTESYFRAPEVAWDAAGLTVTQDSVTMPIAQINSESWLDSVVPVTDLDTSDGTAVDEVTGLYDALDERRLMYERLRELNMVTASYEDWLRMNGVQGVPQEAVIPKPELIMFNREWVYPSNTVDPATGTPSSAASWAIKAKADQSRAFKEPGFLFGVTVCRPKVYLSRQLGNAASLMSSALNWLPKMAHEAAASIIEVTKTVGPLGSGVADGTSPAQNYVVDLRDLFLYGDQFVNFALTETDGNLVALPTTAMLKRFPAQADINGLFTGSTEATRKVAQDGVVSLHVLGLQRDQTQSFRS